LIFILPAGLGVASTVGVDDALAVVMVVGLAAMLIMEEDDVS
jgi:hypothetical protein